MSHLPDLRDSLVGAAARRYQTPVPRRRWRSALGAISLAGAVIVALAVVAVALTIGGRGSHGSRAASQHHIGTSAIPGRQALIDTLAVLRRPQTAADRTFAKNIIRPHAVFVMRGAPDMSLIRYATTTPWGERVFLVPFLPPTAKQLAQLKRHSHGVPRNLLRILTRRGETLNVFSGGGGGGGATAASIKADGTSVTEGAGRSFAGGATQERLIDVVPDGVAKVEFVLPRQPNLDTYGAKVYAHVLRVTVPVHDNIAAAQVNRECCGSGVTIWYAPDGHEIKQIGSLASANRVVAPPKPGPETPQSLAAQRNPSTPNPVWVTPAIGGPHTAFKIHFRVLLNGADYNYHFSGTNCPRYTFPGGTGKPNALRGSLWSDSISAVMGQALCPGTYHVAVTVMDLGRAGNVKHPTHPFGTATFTVR